MLQQTPYIVSEEILQQARLCMPDIDCKFVLNEPTGKFFYDPWNIKADFRDTVWARILDIIPEHKGEARLIKLCPGECYPSHADLDDRWHLSITGNHSYVIDLERHVMYKTDTRGNFFEMNAGIRHTAANFGSEDRIQLVIRKLLSIPIIKHPKIISIRLKQIVSERRFIFDDVISPWLNRAHKLGIIDNFKGVEFEARFTLEESYIEELRQEINDYFILTVE